VGVVKGRSDRRTIAFAWAALAAGTFAWFGSQQFGSNLAFAACPAGTPLAHLLIGFLALALAAGGGLLSLGVWRSGSVEGVAPVRRRRRHAGGGAARHRHHPPDRRGADHPALLRMKRALGLLALAAPTPALAHGGEGEGWHPELSIWIPLMLFAAVYAAGFLRLRSRSDHGRAGLRRGATLFAAGWLTLAAATGSPLHQAGEHSFLMHMIEHELIMLPAALLLVLAKPGPVLLWAFPVSLRGAFAGAARGGRPLWAWLAAPVTATLIQAGAMWLWHMPPLFDRALDSEGWHVAQHLSFLVAALLFWWAIAHGRTTSYGLAAFCLFLTSLIGGALGALMAFSTSPWYAPYAALGMTPAGLSPAEDQQLAGLVMWVPGGAFHAAAALYFLYRWLKASEVAHVAAE
jgi:putative membrane protein